MGFMTIFTLALAAGLAVAKPINDVQSLPAYSKRQFDFNSVINGNRGGNNDGFNFIDGFQRFNQQQQVINVQEKSLTVVDNRFQRQVVQQVQQVIVVDQVNNGFNNDMNNLFRKSNFRNRFRDVTTVMIVVQTIKVAIDNGRGDFVRQDIFAQSVVVANRGARRTQEVMIFDTRTLVAQDILRGNAIGRLGSVGGVAGATGVVANALPTKTAEYQLLGAKPTWSAVADDPAADLGGIWADAVQDMQNNANDGADIQLNAQIAEQAKAALDAAGQSAQS
ncbi:hypothetical protein GMOD_00008367 [Pyrenophora seminiperda CCB06]|uniref:Uncharacterized protein n=1 Tax=Pyrenophora seminiperda CCB06 TaxID=1302712 RepID=A0A3M7M2D3_9PLEO|nr:hypothetical protein GMOD_00008367 [Pyrenophora seminiperda CCB06]